MSSKNSNFPASDLAQTRIALRITSFLNEGLDSLPSDITERLRFARQSVVQRAQKRPVYAENAILNGTSTLALAPLGSTKQPSDGGWWRRLAFALPLAALLGGLVTIQNSYQISQINAAADIDTALLADELPPMAYSDPGFVEFLKSSPN